MLISDAYRLEQQALHETGTYGTASIGYAPLVSEILNKLEVSHLLDYGCGSLINLYKHITPKKKLTYQAYDPGVPDYAEEPVPAEMVCCIDVLEHIEPDFLDSVLDDLQRLTEVVLFCTVHTGPAMKHLSDGRNAHLTQEPMSWWLPKLWERFDIQTVQVTGEHQFHVIAYAQQRAIEDVNGSKASSKPRLVVK
jgi:hypothetical protein